MKLKQYYITIRKSNSAYSFPIILLKTGKIKVSQTNTATFFTLEDAQKLVDILYHNPGVVDFYNDRLYKIEKKYTV